MTDYGPAYNQMLADALQILKDEVENDVESGITPDEIPIHDMAWGVAQTCVNIGFGPAAMLEMLGAVTQDDNGLTAYPFFNVQVGEDLPSKSTLAHVVRVLIKGVLTEDLMQWYQAWLEGAASL